MSSSHVLKVVSARIQTEALVSSSQLSLYGFSVMMFCKGIYGKAIASLFYFTKL